MTDFIQGHPTPDSSSHWLLPVALFDSLPDVVFFIKDLNVRYVFVNQTLAGLEEVTRWILSWGSKAKALGPPELVKGVREEIEKMMNSQS